MTDVLVYSAPLLIVAALVALAWPDGGSVPVLVGRLQ